MGKYDVLIKKGFIVDGTGKPGFIGDIGIKEDKIVKISPEIQGEAEKVINAQGEMVSPGFIDPHVHFETTALHDGSFEVFLKQGVTTTINGNCGHSVTPLDSANVYEYYYLNGLITEEAKEKYKKEQPSWNTFEGYCNIIREKGININLGLLLGHGTIRWTAMGGSKDRPPTPEEEQDILRYIEEGMEQGALGISTGLSYIPSRYANTEEIIKCAKVVAKHEGVYATHARYYEGYLESTLEAIEIGEKSGARVQVSHLTATSPESFDAVLEASKKGLEIVIDTIPRSTGHCTRKDRLIQFIMAVSSELFDQGVEGVKAALRTPEGRKLVLEDAYIFGNDMNQVFVINTGNAEIEYKSIQEIANEQGIEDPQQVLLDLLADDNDQYTFWLGGPSRKDFPIGPHPKNIQDNPLVMVGTDIIFGEPWDVGSWYELQRRGGFPIFMNMYREGGVAVEEIVRRNTSLAAQQFRIKDRGILQEGMKADIAIIHLDKYHYPSPTEIDYTNPEVNAEGVEYVLVNGKIALEEGNVLKTYAGEVIVNQK
ncbi:amidohydrolase family protein [Irregularibacter muris]|uniref:Amidohydrolase family protein n=1 Tax=Irregularibacter muris TaxID=1796619 RepID=A0AAE3HIP4_9FIRM|nr:amidohydrolase family protein [Irregularibacter muris]MCR1899333.1 amidohydrolase family protein [Irregularibacter muris]